MTALETGKPADRARLLSAIHAATAAMGSVDPATRFRKAMDRLGELLAERGLERRYNPQWELQPRVPQGNPDGGQWTQVGSGQAPSLPIRLAAEISGFTRHGINQAITRGVSPSAILDAVANPIRIRVLDNGTTRYIGRDAVVVLNPAGGVVTVWGQ